MSHSTVPLVKAALLSQLQTRTYITTNKVQVVIGHPGGRLERTCIVIGAVIEGKHTPKMVGPSRMPRDEEYTLELLCFVTSPGGSPSDVEAAAYALMGEVEDHAADHKNLDGVVTNFKGLWVSGFEERESGPEDSGGWFHTIAIGIRCSAYLI